MKWWCLFINFTQITRSRDTQVEGRSRHVFEYARSSVRFERGAKKCESISSFQPSYLSPFMFGVRDRDDNQWNIYTIMKRLVKFIQNRERRISVIIFIVACPFQLVGFFIRSQGCEMMRSQALPHFHWLFFPHILLMMSQEDVCRYTWNLLTVENWFPPRRNGWKVQGNIIEFH